MKKYNPVECPERIVTQNRNGKIYVYLTKKVVYNPKKKRSIPDRVYIGILNDDGKLIPNQNYVDIFGGEEEYIDPYNRGDYISVGLHSVVSSIAKKMQASYKKIGRTILLCNTLCYNNGGRC